jgi:hypothetical protein
LLIAVGDIEFDFGHLIAGDKIWLDDVVVEEVTDPLTDGNVCNGDFEEDVVNESYYGSSLLYGWTIRLENGVSMITYEIDETNPIAGEKSMKLSNWSGTVGDGWENALNWVFRPVYGKQYTLDFKAKATEPFILTAEAWDFWDNGGRSNPLFSETFQITDLIQTFQLSAPANAVVQYGESYYLSFQLANIPNNASLWLDDIRLYQWDQFTGIRNEIKEKENVSIYGRGKEIFINAEHQGQVHVYNLSGQLVLTSMLTPGVNTLRMQDGIYVVQVIENGIIVKSNKLLLN